MVDRSWFQKGFSSKPSIRHKVFVSCILLLFCFEMVLTSIYCVGVSQAIRVRRKGFRPNGVFVRAVSVFSVSRV